MGWGETAKLFGELGRLGRVVDDLRGLDDLKSNIVRAASDVTESVDGIAARGSATFITNIVDNITVAGDGRPLLGTLEVGPLVRDIRLGEVRAIREAADSIGMSALSPDSIAFMSRDMRTRFYDYTINQETEALGATREWLGNDVADTKLTDPAAPESVKRIEADIEKRTGQPWYKSAKIAIVAAAGLTLWEYLDSRRHIESGLALYKGSAKCKVVDGTCVAADKEVGSAPGDMACLSVPHKYFNSTTCDGYPESAQETSPCRHWDVGAPTTSHQYIEPRDVGSDERYVCRDTPSIGTAVAGIISSIPSDVTKWLEPLMKWIFILAKWIGGAAVLIAGLWLIYKFADGVLEAKRNRNSVETAAILDHYNKDDESSNDENTIPPYRRSLPPAPAYLYNHTIAY